MKRVGIDISRKLDNERHLIEPLSEEVARIFRRRGIQPIIYDCASSEHEDPYCVRYRDQMKQMNKDKLDCSISLHLGEGDKDVRGAFCYYFSTKGSRLAQNIADKLCPILPGREKQTLHNPNLTILVGTKHPCCVVFAGFMTSPDDMDIFHRRREDIAFAIADGIGKFLNNK